MDGKAHAGSEKEGCPTIRRQSASLLFWNGIRKPLYLNLFVCPQIWSGNGITCYVFGSIIGSFCIVVVVVFFNLLYAM